MENYKLYIHKFPNGKVYVGITSQDVGERWRHGEGYKDQLVYRAILKYGWVVRWKPYLYWTKIMPTSG